MKMNQQLSVVCCQLSVVFLICKDTNILCELEK